MGPRPAGDGRGLGKRGVRDQPNAFLMLLPRFEKNPEMLLFDLGFTGTTFFLETAASGGGIVAVVVVRPASWSWPWWGPSPGRSRARGGPARAGA